MEEARRIQLGKFISLILRHHPEQIGIKLDKHGWADVEELINGINKDSACNINKDILENIVKTNDKQRYSFNEDHTKIRANQGHSIKVDVELKEVIPPKILYHGTAERFMSSIIASQGLTPQSRLHVHLTEDKELARKNGSRYGKPVILKVDTQKMGIKFYKSENNVYLVNCVPIKCISEER